MRLRNITGSRDRVANSPLIINDPEQYKGKWNSYFGNANPIHIEAGMGKGRFIMEVAKQHPGINYLGIEMYSSVLYRALKKLEIAAPDISNLRLLRMDARDLAEVFANGEVSRIYLNFSDPWPKDRHAKRRITSRDFLAIYHTITADDGQIEFKTDNEKLFYFSLTELENSDWHLDKVSYDLHNDIDMMVGNIKTEYEEKFSALGNPIYKYVIKKK